MYILKISNFRLCGIYMYFFLTAQTLHFLLILILHFTKLYRGHLQMSREQFLALNFNSSMLLLHSFRNLCNNRICFLNIGHNFIFQQRSTNSSLPQCHFPVRCGNFESVKLVNKYVFHYLLVIQDVCGIVSHKPQFFLRVLALVILSL